MLDNAQSAFHIILLILCLSLPSWSRDSTEVLQLYELGKQKFPNQMDSALLLMRQGLDLADSLQYNHGQLSIYRALSGIEAYMGRYDESINWVNMGLALVRKHNLPVEEQVNFLINKGVAQSRAGEVGRALETYIEAEELARENRLVEKRAILLNNIGVLYRQLGRYDEAIRIYSQSLAIRRSLQDTLGMANNHYNLASSYVRKGAFQQAIAQADSARTLYAWLESESDILQTDLATADALFQMGREEQSYAILIKLYEQDELLFPLHDLAAMYTLLGRYHNNRGQPGKAEFYLQEISADLERSDLSEFKLAYFEERATAKAGLNDHSAAYNYLKMGNGLSAEMAIKESEKLRREMETKYLTKEKEWELESKEWELEKTQRQKWLLLAGIIALALMVLLIYRISRLRSRANAMLRDKNIIIEKALGEKEILIREIHHRVKNNLQFISSLLALQTEHVEDTAALGALQEGQDRVQSMALIHQNLYQEDNLTGVDVKAYFVKLIRNLFDSYNIRKGQIQLDLDVSEIELDVDTIIPIGLIVNELVSNCLKYAFVDKDQGSILVRLFEQDEKLVLEVADNGQGMSPQELKNLGSSFGYRLIHVFKDQLDAELEIQQGAGTTVIMRIAKYEKI